jgi:hypothetical protein
MLNNDSLLDTSDEADVTESLSVSVAEDSRGHVAAERFQLSDDLDASELYDPASPEISPSSLPPRQLKAWKRQEEYLAAYAASNSETAGCNAAGITRRIVRLWRLENYLDFRQREIDAHSRFTDEMESHLAYLAFGTKPGQNVTPVLAILNAELPNKYRPQGPPPDANAAEIASRLRAMAKDDKQPAPDATVT